MLNNKALPPLDYLIAFEAAALLGGFANASKHLNISESSISRKVRLLEEHYDRQLFVRKHRSVVLTKCGDDLLASVTVALNILRDKSDELISHEGMKTVSVAATHSVAALWLSPRLSSFQLKHSDIAMTLTASDSDDECLDEAVHYPILRGQGDWPGFKSELLFGETIFPVCSPSYLETHLLGDTLDTVSHHDLIEVSNHHLEWMNWAHWLGEKNVPKCEMNKTAIFNTYPLAVQAAIGGLGVMLGWSHLVDPYLESGQLVRPYGTQAVTTQSGYYLLRRKGHSYNAAQKAVRKWLIAEAASSNLSS